MRTFLKGGSLVQSEISMSRRRRWCWTESFVRHNFSGHKVLLWAMAQWKYARLNAATDCAIGIASNKLRRFGLNFVEKRKRLIRAGADLIIPDFGSNVKNTGCLQLNKSARGHGASRIG